MRLAFATQSIDLGASYIPVVTVHPGGHRPTNTYEAPPVPTGAILATHPAPNSYRLYRSFKITDKPVTRTFNWTIS